MIPSKSSLRLHPGLQWIKTLAVGTLMQHLKRGMPTLKLVCAPLPFVFLMACASGPNADTPSAPTKADIQARDEFARNLPKPPER
jgi:hypothetical protein